MSWWRGRGWGWKGGWRGPWPGNGPFSYLPPWLRPGWLLGGRGACWRLYGIPGWAYWAYRYTPPLVPYWARYPYPPYPYAPYYW